MAASTARWATLTNDGTITLAGSNEHTFFNDGTLDDFGSIIQTGSGNLGLHSDNQLPDDAR